MRKNNGGGTRERKNRLPKFLSSKPSTRCYYTLVPLLHAIRKQYIQSIINSWQSLLNKFTSMSLKITNTKQHKLSSHVFTVFKQKNFTDHLSVNRCCSLFSHECTFSYFPNNPHFSATASPSANVLSVPTDNTPGFKLTSIS